MTDLKQLPDGVSETLEVVAGYDACLMSGLSRLAGDQRDSLQNFADTFVGTPLQEVMQDAANRLLSGEFMASSLLAFAAGRASLLGATHDALQAQLCTQFNLENKDWEAGAPSPSPHSALLSSVQQWLLELAVTGFENLEEAQLAPFSTTLDQIQAELDLTGLGALLSGALAEWRGKLGQRDAMEQLHQRWGDLWTAAYLTAQQGPVEQTFKLTSGTFVPVGVDIRQHGHFVAASFYGVLDKQAVRVPFTSYKVGVVAGDETWKLFRPMADPYLKALQDHKSVEIEDAELSACGDLTGGTASVGTKIDIFDLEILQGFSAIEPTRRHPIQIAQLVRLDDCVVSVENKLATHINGLEIAQNRNLGIEELPATHVALAKDFFALIRFDGTWQVQPLAVRGKGKTKAGILAGQNIFKRSNKLKASTLEILSERADKLLRA